LRPLPSAAHGETHLGRFEIKKELDEGGMGRVYVAHDPKLARDVALKLLRARGGAAEPHAEARVLREARAAAALSHPNVAAIYDVGEHESLPFIAMELVVGRSLRRIVADGVALVPWRTRVRWLLDVARALHAAHDAGIVHRDMKPENVVVRDDGIVKVIDFGIARHAPQAGNGAIPTPSGERGVGTPLYMAPEQIEERTVDGRADQFAWGVMGYEVLTGDRPWRRLDDRAHQLATILATPPAPPRLEKGVPAKVGVVIMRALEKAADARFASMADAAEALDEATRRGKRK
jgi:serine/threonine-protein kinase